MAWHCSRGLPPGLLLFHESATSLSAIRSTDGHYVTVNSSYVVEATFGTFDSWFREVLLKPYADIYGLNAAL